jgi:hypothetical protein
VELITEAQLHFGKSVFLKLNNSFGLTPKGRGAEVGVIFAFL